MASVIIDNSTLTAVQRLTGSAEAPRSYDPQGDYSALENFLAHLLFGNEFFYIDDYKDQYRSSREEEFTYIRKVPPGELPYDELEAAAVDLTSDLLLDIRAGRVTDGLLKEFLESMDLHVTCAWHMRSSDFFLTLKILADEPDQSENLYKYSPLTALIFNQLSGNPQVEIAKSYNLIGSNGSEIPERREEGDRAFIVDDGLLAFANSLNWLARRTAFYTLICSQFSAQACLHPIRHNFLSRWSSSEGLLETSQAWRDNITSFFGRNAEKAINSINDASEASEVGITLPLFAAWAVGNTGSVSSAIQFILETRQGPLASSIREKFSQVEQIRAAGDIVKYKKELNDICRAIEQECSTLVRRYGAAPGGAPNVSLSAELSPIPKLSASMRFDLPNLGLTHSGTRQLRSLLRNVVDDVVRFDKLGDVRRALTSEVRRSKDSSVPALHLEERRYFGRETDWKKRM